ncbi:ATP-binding protein [Candidatus Babeliales bacterium]|nr:ATP-binding protein [Candidatus Babeliales bacterium]MBP9844202.1 ATP-binding protein [Candidatus Babeliales bacterium]
MKRIIDYYLLEWKWSRLRKPLLLRGARQVGKTYAARQLGATYESFVEINLEYEPETHKAFSGKLDPKEIITILSAQIVQKIIPGKTLLFIDEIQACPQAIIALRYFYELMPELHIIAAGSLLDFAIAQVGAPVGRIQALYMHPISFIEYLANTNPIIVQTFLDHPATVPIQEPIHTKCLQLLSRYLAIGGMPQAIQDWINYQDPLAISSIHTSILDFYRQDFNKYAKNHEIKYVEKIFNQIPHQLGNKFKYSLIDGDYRKRELSPALDLLITAGIARKVYYAAGQGVPLGAQQSDLDYKVIFLDVGLAQSILKLNLAQWLTQPLQEFINKGSLVEAFVGQELATYSNPATDNNLYYWHKDSSPQQAEIDYLLEIETNIIPIEVKSGDGRTLKSLHRFLDLHTQSPYGIKFSTQNYFVHEKIHSLPLYAIAQVMSNANPSMKNAILSMIATPKIIHYHPDQFSKIEDQIINMSPFQEEVAMIIYQDDGYEPYFNTMMNDLKNHAFKEAHGINLLQNQHKNLRIVQVMHKGKIIWQKVIRT